MKIAVFVMAIMVMCICPGSISEGNHPVPEPRHYKPCRFPKANHGSVRTDGCIKNTCTNGKWKPKMRTDICCYKQKVHKPNTVLEKIVSADNCSSITIGCGAVGELEFKHKSCSDPASKQQVDQLEKNMEQQFVEVVAKIENVNETSGKHSVEIYETVKEVNKEIQKMNNSVANKVDDLKNTTTRQSEELSEKVNHAIQKIENNKISIENHSNALSRKIENQTEEIAKKIQKINISIEHKVDDLKNTTRGQSEELSDKINDVVQKIDKNKISSENQVNALAGKLENQTEEIAKKIQKINISIENKVDDLKNTTRGQSEELSVKINDVVQKIDKNKISRENQVNALSGKLENQTEEIAKKIQKINISIENKVEDLKNTTRGQIEELSDKINDVVQKIDKNKISRENQVSALSRKLENQTEEITKKIQKMNISIENKVDDLKNETTWQNVELSDKVNYVVQKIENLTKTVNQNIADQNEMSLQMMKTLFNLTKLMEKNSEDTHIVEGEQYTTTYTATTTPLPIVEGVLITGGSDTSTELFLPHTGKTCSLQSLPDRRYGHSIDVIGNKTILCGGGSGSSSTSCLQFLTNSSTGTWVNYATLVHRRYEHASHVFKDDLLLTGGQYSSSAEILGSNTPQYNLKQDTTYACSIPDMSTYILTGGRNSHVGDLNTVARYNTKYLKGFVENLPDLNQKRWSHGCGSYMNNNTKVFVVAGGFIGWNPGTLLSSTELFTSGATSWHSGESLPRAIRSLGSVNMDNYILMIGGRDIYGKELYEIQKFNGSWTDVGMMKTGRQGVRAAKIQIGNQLDIQCQG